MKLTIKKQTLLSGLARVIDAAQTKITMPVLCSVLLDADTGLAISATNLDVHAQTSVPAEIKETGKIAINAKRLLEIARSAPSEIISISANKLRVSVKSGGASFNFSGMDAAEFPELPKYSSDNAIEAAAESIFNMLNSVAFCQGTDASRSFFMGIHSVLGDGQLVFEATNGARLARNCKAYSENKSKFSVIIPTFTVSIIAKLLKDASHVVIMADSNFIAAHIVNTEEGSETLIVSKVIQSQYPDVTRVIPTKVNSTIKITREQLSGIVGRVSLACSDRSPGVKLSVTKGQVAISASSAENGEASESMDGQYDGTPMELAFSSKFLSDALSNVAGETINIGLIDSLSPAVFSNDDSGYVHILMPYRQV